MSEAPALLYLEADDEITTVIRRLRAAEGARVVVVAPGRSRATSSVVALRLLARAGEEDGRDVAVVGDALTRSLAAEAGLDAFASVEDAKRASPGATAAAEPHRAAIHIVRGPAADDTAPTLAAAPAVAARPISEEMTRPVPIVGPRRAPPSTPRSVTGRRRAVSVALAAALAALLVLGSVAAATLLPAATVSIAPRTEAIGPVEYEIVVADPSELGDTVTATATVTATGTYRIQEAASGTVVLFNWTFFPVEVPAGTFVAAGEQAFATQSDVMVPRGRLTGAGTIAAGDVEVAVVAAAAGPAGNVPAEAIDTVVDEEIDARLRGFPENPQPRVINPDATSGGVDTSGPEITQADVEAAVASLREELATRAQAASTEAATANLLLVRADLPDPQIEGVDGLAGTRDAAEAEISGSLAWQALAAPRDEVVASAEERFAGDTTILPRGHGLLPEATVVELGEARQDGGRVVVGVKVTGRSAPSFVEDEVRQRIAGRTVEEARSAVADLGPATIELWPGWVTTVPTVDWRVEVRIGEAEAEAGAAGP